MMRRFLLAGVVLAFASPALAGTITFSVVAPGINASKVFTYKDADLARFADAMIKAYGPTVVTSAPGVTPVTTRAMTRLEALAAWADGMMKGTENNVLSIEREAAKAAVAEPPVFSP